METMDIDFDDTPPSSMEMNSGRQHQFLSFHTAQPPKAPSLIIKKRARLGQIQPFHPNSLSKIKKQDFLGKIKRRQRMDQFVKRLRLNNPKRSDVDHSTLHSNLIGQQSSKQIKQLKEYNQHKNMLQFLIMLAKIALLIGTYVATSLSFVFGQIKNVYQITIFLYLIYFSMIAFEVADWAIKLCEQSQRLDYLQVLWVKTKKYKNILQISIGIIAIVNLSIRTDLSFILALSIIIYKLMIFRGYLQEKEIYIIHSQTVSKYWDIVKIVIFNLIAAHTLSIILNLVGTYSIAHHSQNWYSLKGIDLQNWTQRYVWGYYWSISIMFTVGFGDINATNISQAMVIIFASIVSCLALSYNISEINRILQRLNTKNEELKSKLSQFDIITSRYGIQPQLKGNIERHIQQQIQDQYQYDYVKEQQIINELPNKLKHQFKREINKSLFAKLTFFKDLGKKTQYQIAQNLVNKIAFPDSIYMKKNQRWKISILRLGELRLCHQRDSSRLNGLTLEKFSVKNGEIGELMSLKFIKGKVLQGNLVATKRSIISQMQVEDFEQNLKNTNPYMHQYYCQIRDRNEEYLFNYGTKKCELCPHINHSKHDCPKLHIFPLKHFIIYKEIMRNGMPQKREAFLRQKQSYRVLFSPLWQDIRQSLQRSNITRVFHKTILKSVKLVEQEPTEQNSETPPVIKRFQKVQKQLNRIISLIKCDQNNEDVVIEVDKAFNFKRYHSNYNSSELQRYDFRKGRVAVRDTTKKTIKRTRVLTYFQSLTSNL